jgi:hypothetical protein
MFSQARSHEQSAMTEPMTEDFAAASTRKCYHTAASRSQLPASSFFHFDRTTFEELNDAAIEATAQIRSW